MEHGIILLIQAILAIDRNLQKPIRAVVPDLSQLRADPKSTFADREIIFGPRRAYAASAVVGCLVSGFVLLIFGLVAMDRPPKQPVEPWYFVAAGLSVFVSGAAAAALMVRWLRGGSAILCGEGVAFVHRGRTVFCPWELFQSVGTPYQPDERRVIVPANDSTPVALTDTDGNVTAKPAEQVKSKPLAGCKDGQVALADLYEVRLGEFAELLLFLGRQLGNGSVDRNGDASALSVRVPLATAEPKGWLRIRLTRLPFPPVCVACGAYTADSVEHTFGTSNRMKISVPLCRTCQSERSRKRFRAAMIGVGLGLAPAFLAGLIALAIRDLETTAILLAVSAPLGILTGIIGGLIARDRVEPVRFTNYSAESGTVDMRLRTKHGASAFRQALNLPSEFTEQNSE